MWCNGLISGSESRCHLLTRPSGSSTISIPDPCIRLVFNTRLPKPVLIRVGSVKVRATINDGFVAEAAGMTFYELLGIPESGTLPEIKQAYKQLALKYHPDVSPPGRVEEYTRRFIRVQEAYETLSDPSRRAMYDRDMARGLNLAFSARKRCYNDEAMEERSEWKNRCEVQLSELKRRSMYKDAGENMSWGARMRKQRSKSSVEL